MNTISIHGQTVAYEGDASMLLCPMTAYLSSHREPQGTTAAVRAWVDSLDSANSCVLCGNMTSGERYTLRTLAERGIPVVLTLSTAIPQQIEQLRLDPPCQQAYSQGRLVIITPVIDQQVTAASAQTSAARNQLMIALAEHIVVGFMAENGNLQRQLLGQHNVSILKADGHEQVRETNEQQAQRKANQMAWAIYHRLHACRPDSITDDAITSVEVRTLLAQYLKLEGLERPSLLHSLLLYQVVSKYAIFTDFDFTSFIRMWNLDTLRPEDWRSAKVNNKWVPSLAERVLARLMKALPSRFKTPVNPNERFDPVLAHQLLDRMMTRSKSPNKKMIQRALNLAYFEHDSANIEKYRKLIKPSASQ